MPQSDVSTWLKFAIQQIAAESYLDGPGTLDEKDEKGVGSLLMSGSYRVQLAIT
jgi:hypothetical protein